MKTAATATELNRFRSSLVAKGRTCASTGNNSSSDSPTANPFSAHLADVPRRQPDGLAQFAHGPPPHGPSNSLPIADRDRFSQHVLRRLVTSGERSRDITKGFVDPPRAHDGGTASSGTYFLDRAPPLRIPSESARQHQTVMMHIRERQERILAVQRAHHLAKRALPVRWIERAIVDRARSAPRAFWREFSPWSSWRQNRAGVRGEKLEGWRSSRRVASKELEP